MRRYLIPLLLSLVLALMVCSLGVSAAQSGTLRIAFVPKLIGIPYFTAMEEGGKAAGKDLGVEFIYTGPVTADPGKQVEIVDNLITRGVDVIAVAPNDPASVIPVLAKAKERGIIVMTSDTDSPESCREVFVSQAIHQEIGYTVMDELAKAMNYEGEFAIISGGPAAWNLNEWIKFEKERLAAKYPKMKLVTIRYAEEDVQLAINAAMDILTAYPNLKGILGNVSTGTAGAAQALEQTGKAGKVALVGLGTPLMMKDFVHRGTCASFVLWDPVKLGYLTVWVGKELAEGRALKAWNDVPKVGKVEYRAADKMVILGPPLVFNKSNVDKYNF